MRWTSTVFLSHTGGIDRGWVDACMEAVAQAGALPDDMRLFTSDSETTTELCAERIRKADVFVSLVGDQFGSRVPGDMSFCEYEYNIALDRGLKVLVFVLPGARATADLDQRRFLARLEANHTLMQVATPSDLEAAVFRSLVQSLIRAGSVEDEERLPAPERRFRKALLDDLTRVWIRDYAAAGLHANVRLPLTFAQRRDLLTPRLSAPSAPSFVAEELVPSLLEDRKIGRLLVLGGPGAGKTTFLLVMASRQMARVRSDFDDPLPVIVNLSTWSPRYQSLSRWLERELWTKYATKPKLTRDWLAGGSLTLYLDGIDELPEAHRAGCIRAINAFFHDHGHVKVVVACRSEEYQGLQGRLELATVAEIQPLNYESTVEKLEAAGLFTVAAYLRQARSDWNAIYSNPLALTVLVRLFAEDPPAGEEFQALSSRHALYERFVCHALDPARRQPREHVPIGRKDGILSPEEARRHLGLLAAGMDRANAGSVLRPREWTPAWLGSRKRRRRVRKWRLFLYSLGLSLAVLVLTALAMTLDNGFRPETVAPGMVAIEMAAAGITLTFSLVVCMCTCGIALAIAGRSPRHARLLARVTGAAIALVVVSYRGQWDAVPFLAVLALLAGTVAAAERLKTASSAGVAAFAPACVVGSLVGLLVFVSATLDGMQSGWVEVTDVSLAGLATTAFAWTLVHRAGTTVEQSQRIALSFALGGSLATLTAMGLTYEGAEYGWYSVAAGQIAAFGGDGADELQRVVLGFSIAALLMHLTRPDPAEEVLFAPTERLHWSWSHIRQRSWGQVAGVLAAAGIFGATAFTLLGRYRERTLVGETGIPPAILGAAAVPLVLGLRRTRDVDDVSSLRSNSLPGALAGGAVVAFATAASVGSIFSPESALLFAGTPLILVSGRPLAASLSHRFVRTSLIAEGALARRPSRLFDAGLSSGLLRGDSRTGYRYIHETFRAHLAATAQRGETGAPSRLRAEVLKATTVIVGAVGLSLMGVAWFIGDRSPDVQLNDAYDLAALDGSTLVAATYGEPRFTLLDVRGARPRRLAPGSEQGPEARLWPGAGGVMVESQELRLYADEQEDLLPMPDGELIAADVPQGLPPVVVLKKEAELHLAAFSSAGRWERRYRLPDEPLDIVADKGRHVLRFEDSIVAFAADGSGPVARRELDSPCGGISFRSRSLFSLAKGVLVRCRDRAELLDHDLQQVLAVYPMREVEHSSATADRVALLSSEGPTLYVIDGIDGTLRKRIVPGEEGISSGAYLVAVVGDRTWVVTPTHTGVLPRSEASVDRVHEVRLAG